MANKLRIDLEQLNDTINKYDNSISSFETMIRMIDISLDNLKNSGWRSAAKNAFFSQYDDKWKKNMKTHIDILKHLRDCLINARSEYVGIINEIPSIGNIL